MLNSGHERRRFGVWLNKLAPALCLLTLSFLATGCPKEERPPSSRIGTSDPLREVSPRVVPGAVAFNGQRAMDHVRKQLEIGPRIPGSPELARTREYILGSLKSSGLVVTTDEFIATTPFGEKSMINLTAEVPGESKNVIIVASHYDSKFYKDMRFVGANDPATSVATLLELGRVLGAEQQKPRLTYWLVFFDGEESLCEDWEQCQNPNPADPKSPLPDNTYGSRRYVARLRENDEVSRVRALILLDMMGYKNLELGRDTMSTRWLQDIVWETARKIGYAKYFVERREDVGGDDHEPFLKAGIDSLDIIQLTGYPYWHRADDTIDKVSAESMKVVGEVVLASLPKIAEHLAARPATTESTRP